MLRLPSQSDRFNAGAKVFIPLKTFPHLDTPQPRTGMCFTGMQSCELLWKGMMNGFLTK